jgi:hypothetical protein
MWLRSTMLVSVFVLLVSCAPPRSPSQLINAAELVGTVPAGTAAPVRLVGFMQPDRSHMVIYVAVDSDRSCAGRLQMSLSWYAREQPQDILELTAKRSIPVVPYSRKKPSMRARINYSLLPLLRVSDKQWLIPVFVRLASSGVIHGDVHITLNLPKMVEEHPCSDYLLSSGGHISTTLEPSNATLAFDPADVVSGRFFWLGK